MVWECVLHCRDIDSVAGVWPFRRSEGCIKERRQHPATLWHTSECRLIGKDSNRLVQTGVVLQADCWSVGAIMFEIYTGKTPFYKNTTMVALAHHQIQ